MMYRKFGKTYENVSALGFGCMRLPILQGNDPSKINAEETIKLIRTAIDEGVNYVDTAYPYHGTGMDKPGESEPVLAKVLKNGYRDRVKIATKLPSWLIRSREDMDNFLNHQLKRLETDCIDFYLIHSVNQKLWPNLKEKGVSEFLNQALKDNRIKYAGFSFHDKLALFKEVVDSYDWSFCQIQYNYMDDDFQAGTEGLRYAAGKGMGIAVMEPLRGGALANSIPKEGTAIFRAVDEKRTPSEWALKWVLNHPEVSVVLSGMNSMQQVEENIKTASETEAGKLSKNELDAIEQVKKIFKSKIKVPCTGCEYCMPCTSGVDIPTCFAKYNEYFMYNQKGSYSFLLQPGQRASACTECGICESRCPQGIAIRNELKTVVEVMEK